MSRYFKSTVIFLFCFLLTTQIVQTQAVESTPPQKHQSIKTFESHKKIDLLLLLMQKRLSVMHEVARVKWNQNLPIDIPAQEQKIIEAVLNQPSISQIDPQWMRKFLQAQFDAAKAIQNADFEVWTTERIQKFDSLPDLQQDLRPYLMQLSNELIEALVGVYPELKDGKLSEIILLRPISTRSTDRLDKNIWKTAITPLLEINSP